MQLTRLAALVFGGLLAPALVAQPPRPGGELPKHARARIGDSRFYGGGHRLLFAPDGKTLAVADHNRVRLLDVATGNETLRLSHVRPPNVNTAPPIPSTVVELAFTRDGKAIVSADEDGGLHLWKVADGSETSRPHLHPGVATLCLAGDEKAVFTAGFDGVVRQWQLPALKPVNSWEAPGKEPVLALAVVGKQLAGVTRDGVFVLWDPATGKETRRTDLGPVLLGTAFDFGARKFPASGSTYPGFASYPRNVEFSPDGKRLAQHQGRQIWDVEAGKVIANLTPSEDTVRLAFSGDGKHVVAAPADFKEPMRLFGAASGAEVRRLATGRVSAVAVSPDGGTVAFATFAGNSVRLWNHATGEVLGGRDAVGAIRDWDVSPDGKHVVIATADRGVRIYDSQTGKHQETFATDTKTAAVVRYHPDGRALIVAVSGEGLRHYEKTAGDWRAVRKFAVKDQVKEMHGPGRLVPVGTTTTRLVDMVTGKPQGGLSPRNKYAQFTYSPDGRQLLVGAEVSPKPGTPPARFAQREYQLFELPALTPVRSIKPPTASFAGWRFSPDGRLGLLDTDPIRVVEVFTGAERMTIAVPFRPTAVEFAPDGKSLLAGTAQGEVVVLGVPRGDVLYRTEVAHQAGVKEIRNTPGRQTISVGHDQTLVSWSAALWKGRGGYPAVKLEPDDLDLFYQLLEDPGGPNVGSAVASLIGGGEDTVRFLKAKLRPATEAEKAGTGPPTAARLRARRAVEVLEHIGTPAACAVLAGLARGHPGAPQTVEASEAVARLSAP